MDIFNELKTKNNNYSDKIDINKYTQTFSLLKEVETEAHVITKSIFNSIFELILSIKDVNYCILENKEINKYVSDKKLELCSKIDVDYNNLNFNKKVLSKTTICSNLQKKNNMLSLILFYNEFYKINLIIYNKSSNKFYKTGMKNYDNIYITYDNKKWIINDNINNDYNNYSDINELNTILDIDMKTNFVYNSYLKSLSNYKLDDLVNIANECNISLTNENGKKKTKKDLYEEINLIKLYN